MKRKNKVRILKEGLMRRKLPYVGISFVMIMLALGINKFSDLNKIKNYQELLDSRPFVSVAKEIIDGDTFVLTSDVTVRLLGINAPEKNEDKFEEALAYLAKLIKDKKVCLEYDRYQDEQFVRILAWVWVNCEGEPKFLPYNYMHLTYNQSKPGLMENPEGCQKGQLVNEMMVKKGLAKTVFYKDRGEMKYEERLKKVF